MVFRNKRGRFCRKRYRYEEPKDLPETDHSYALDHFQHNMDSDNNKIGTAKNEKRGGPMKMNNFRVAFNFKRYKTKKLKFEEHAGEEETLELDCESVVDDGELHKQTQSVTHAYTGTDRRKRKSEYRTLDETSNEEEVEFQSIHGLPVNVPFTLQYRSPCARKTLKSKMYVIVEQRVLSYSPVSSMNINVQGDICEHTSEDNVCPFMKDIEEEKMSSWVDIQNVIKQFPLNHDQTKKVASNFPGNSDLSYDPIVIKQEAKDEYFESYISEEMYNKRSKLVQVEETPSICQSEQQSSRLRNRNYRIDYRQFGDLNDVSDVDVIASDIEGADDGDKERSDGRKTKRTSTGKIKRKKQKKKEDQDFHPIKIESKYVPAAHSEFAGDGIKDENLDSNMDEESEQNEAESFPTSEEMSGVRARRMFKQKKMLKRIEQEKSRIRVKLSEHPDKYTIKDFVSFLMQDRGKEDSEKTLKMLVCTQCKKFQTDNEEQMEEHIEQHVNGELSCNECNIHFSNFKEIREHNRIHRKVRIQMRQCPICHLKFKDDKGYRNHLSSIHNLSQEVCKVCLKAGIQVAFSNRCKLQDHFLEHHKDLMHKCNDCERYFRTKTSLTTHSCLAEGKNATTNAPCEICGMVMRKQSIPGHKKRVHFQVRTHPCPDCNFAAKNSWRLKKHIEARHGGVHSMRCDQCTFTCVYRYQLVSHQRTHTGVKPYKCDECPYTAAWNVQLKDHKKLHSNPLGVECPICGVFVKRGTSYTIHMKKEHSDTSVYYQ